MEPNKRKIHRRLIHYTASLVFGPGDSHPCVVTDISDVGARIDIENAEAVPEECILFLSYNGAARRICKVIWRNTHQVGVKFEAHMEHPELVPLAPKPHAEAAPTAAEPAAADHAPLAPQPPAEPASAESEPAEKVKVD
jgi:PilZ domain